MVRNHAGRLVGATFQEKTHVKEDAKAISDSVQAAQEKITATLGRLFDVAQAGSVFSEPISAGDRIVITAAEVTAGVGMGMGAGMGSDEGEEKAEKVEGKTSGGGGGGGGGGGSMARPVATIIIGPSGVQVEPVVDVTKLGIAFFTALGAIFIARRGMRKMVKG
jgi:uncharacterized spore protein YtfJ